MRILHVVSYYNSLMRYQEYYLAREHQKQGHKVFIITSDKNYPFKDYKNTAEPIYGSRIIGTGDFVEEGLVIIRLKSLFDIHTRVFLKGLYKKIKSLSPDLVIIHGIVNFSALQLLFRKRCARYVFDDHMLTNQISKSLPGKAAYALFRIFLKKRLLKVADKIIAISDGCIPVINKVYGVPYERIQMVPLGADIDLFKPDMQTRIETRRSLGIESSEIVLIYTGKIIRGKMPHLIIEAVNGISYKEKVHLLFVGNQESGYSDEFNKILGQSRYPYTLLPNQPPEELAKLFNAADLAVYPSQATISTIEASACSIPVICTNEIPERYKSGNGIGIEPGNVEQLKAAITSLLIDGELREKMGKKGRVYVMKELSWDEISKKFIS